MQTSGARWTWWWGDLYQKDRGTGRTVSWAGQDHAGFDPQAEVLGALGNSWRVCELGRNTVPFVSYNDPSGAKPEYQVPGKGA